ncbi:MAG: hypothetical protein QOG43_2506 [Actinomycetota bacterium]|jgi:hypothetical protein|nr:hypothetical protein [Actinomycetota bacterium]
MSGEPSEIIRLRASDVAWREIDGEVVLLDLKASVYISVNATGTVLWKLLAPGATRSELIGGLMSTFGVDEGQAAVDVDAFVASCRERRLLEG